MTPSEVEGFPFCPGALLYFYTMAPESLILIAVVIAGFIGIFLMLRRKEPEKAEDPALLLLQQQVQEVVRSVNEGMRAVDQKLGQTSDSLQKQVGERLREGQNSVQQVGQQFQSFVKGVTELSETVRQVQGSVKDIASFQDILRAPKLRGSWGELSLEHILAQYFPRDAYDLQHQFLSGEQVDALLKLPNGKTLPIDAKFPLEDFTRMTEAHSDIERASFAKSFVAVCKKEIDDIAKKYILPGEGTVEFALMYIPAEAVYYEVAHRFSEDDIPAYARSRRVVIISPNTFFMMIQIIQHWARDMQVSQQTQEILRRLGRIVTDAQKLSEGFVKTGKHLRDATSAHMDTEKRLGLLVDRVGRLTEAESEVRIPEPTPLVDDRDAIDS